MIYDCFLYDGETDILSVRMGVLAPLDVLHVAVVAKRTFAGERRDPPSVPDGVHRYVASSTSHHNAWQTESYQRQVMAAACHEAGAEEGDSVIAGDVDEIPTVEAVKGCTGGLMAIRMPYHQLLATWQLPLRHDSYHHRFPVVGNLAMFHDGEGFAHIRERSGKLPYVIGGWHLSTMGGPEQILRKLGSYSHHEERWTQGWTRPKLKRAARAGVDIAGRFVMRPRAFCTLPGPIQDNPDRYRVLVDVDAW